MYPIIKTIIFSLALILLLPGCTKKIYFTKELKNRIEQSGQDIQGVQFYNSSDIVLRLNEPDSELEVKSGTIYIKEQQNIQEIIIKQDTRGLCIAAYDDQMNIAFEKGENRFLPFREEDCTRSSTKWKFYTKKSDKGFGQLRYDNANYYATPESEIARLLVKKKQVEKLIQNRRVAKGRKIR